MFEQTVALAKEQISIAAEEQQKVVAANAQKPPLQNKLNTLVQHQTQYHEELMRLHEQIILLKGHPEAPVRIPAIESQVKRVEAMQLKALAEHNATDTALAALNAEILRLEQRIHAAKGMVQTLCSTLVAVINRGKQFGASQAEVQAKVAAEKAMAEVPWPAWVQRG